MPSLKTKAVSLRDSDFSKKSLDVQLAEINRQLQAVRREVTLTSGASSSVAREIPRKQTRWDHFRAIFKRS